MDTGQNSERDSLRLTINGEGRDVPSGLSVTGLLEHLELHPRLVVVEHNGEILRRDDYPEARLADGDALELVHFVGGG